MFILCLYEDNFICIKIGKSIRLINMKAMLLLGVVLSLVFYYNCQSSSLIVNVIEQSRSENITFVCTVSSLYSLTRWTHRNVSGSTRTSLMRFQNGICTLSPSDSFLTNDKRYAYTCNSTVYQVTIIYNTQYNSINNHMFSCRDALQPDGTGSTWIIKYLTDDGTCSYCEPTMLFDVMYVNEGDNVTFDCRVTSDEPYVTWNVNFGSKTAPMGVQNGQCATITGTTFLDNTSEYSYTCNTTVYQVTKLNVQISEYNDMYMCTPAFQQEGKGTNWIIKIKAPVTSVTILPANSQDSVKEHLPLEFTCTTSTSRPAASVYWYIHPNGNSNNVTRITENITTTTDYNDLSVTKSTLRFVSTRLHNNMKIFCTAYNTINTSPVRSNKILLNVLYTADDPYITQRNEFRVIETTSVTLSCSVNGGNPTPTLSWSCINFSPTNQSTINSNGNLTTALTWTVLRNHDGKCTCTSQQTGFQNKTIDVSLVVLYPPSKPVLKVNGGNATGAISFVEGNTRSIECTSDSKPSPDRYTWTGPTIHDAVNTQDLTFIPIGKNDAGQYKCSVHNTMNLLNGSSVVGINNIDVHVDVLYPPMVQQLDNISKLKGKQLNISCNYTSGMPEDTSIKWTKDSNYSEWNTAQLTIDHLKKNDTGNYTCTASNTMIQSGDNISYIGQHKQSFYLDVQYEATIESFTVDQFTSQIVTVNESDKVRFMCHADSNPIAVMTLSDANKILKNVTSNSVEHNISKTSCLDAGTYYCFAKNVHNGANDVNNTVQLFVNCYPRTAYTLPVVLNITSENIKAISIVCNVIAYPPPTFTWWKLANQTWTLLNDNDNTLIISSNVQSNLTIHRVSMEDFTSYKVIVQNDFGQLRQDYVLSPHDKPDSPTHFRHIEGGTTTSSIHLEWNPGFDNGPSQTFYIKYKRSSDTLWNYINVPDNGEQTMEITLTGLTENTLYDIVIFASNELGNSSESGVVITATKAEHVIAQSPGPLIGGVIGGTVGLAIIIALVVYVGRRNGYINDCFGKLRKSDGINHSAEDHAYYNVGRLGNTTNQGSEDTAYSTIGSDTIGVNDTTEMAAYYNVGSDPVPEYEKINRNNMDSTPYSTLEQIEQGTTSEVMSEDKNNVYENLKIQVF